MRITGFYGALWACYSFRLRAVSTCKGEKATFYPFLGLACLLPCSLALCVSAYTRKAARFVGRSFSLGCGVWFLLSELEHGKRCGLFAVYLYFVGLVVGFNPSGGWACDIIQIASICGLCHCLAIIDGYFFSHGVGLLEFKRFYIFFGFGGVFLRLHKIGGFPCSGS